jgi:hypothetical protein
MFFGGGSCRKKTSIRLPATPGNGLAATVASSCAALRTSTGTVRRMCRASAPSRASRTAASVLVLVNTTLPLAM